MTVDIIHNVKISRTGVSMFFESLLKSWKGAAELPQGMPDFELSGALGKVSLQTMHYAGRLNEAMQAYQSLAPGADGRKFVIASAALPSEGEGKSPELRFTLYHMDENKLVRLIARDMAEPEQQLSKEDSIGVALTKLKSAHIFTIERRSGGETVGPIAVSHDFPAVVAMIDRFAEKVSPALAPQGRDARGAFDL